MVRRNINRQQELTDFAFRSFVTGEWRMREQVPFGKSGTCSQFSLDWY